MTDIKLNQKVYYQNSLVTVKSIFYDNEVVYATVRREYGSFLAVPLSSLKTVTKIKKRINLSLVLKNNEVEIFFRTLDNQVDDQYCIKTSFDIEVNYEL